MADETRRAHGAYRLTGARGEASEGEGDTEVTDQGLTVGPLAFEHLDADALADSDRVLTLSPWPQGNLAVSQLARRHGTFAAALKESRDRARTAGLLAHGVTSPASFPGALKEPGPEREARLLVYATHLTVVPHDGDPFQVPYGALSAVRFEAEPWSVALESSGGRVVVGKLARQTDAFRRALAAARDEQGRRLSKLGGSPRFADGVGVPLEEVAGAEGLLEAWTAPERAECVKAILSAADRKGARLGLVELLDPDEESLAAKVPLPENVAAFLLAPVGGKVVLELLSGPSAATYVFEGEPGALNRDLQALHFRRGPLSLTEKEAAGEKGRAYRLALRRLEPLKRLRAAVRARVIHNDGWAQVFTRAVG